MRRWWWSALCWAAIVGCDDGGGESAATPDGGVDPDAAVRTDARVPDGALPAEDGSRPAEDGAPPTEDGAPPAEDGAPPVEDAAPPTEDAAPPAEDGAPPDGAVDPCVGVVCDAPPAPTCVGMDRVVFGAGQCRVTDGELVCEYAEMRVPCGAGEACAEGVCVAAAPPPTPGEIVITEVMYDPIDPLIDETAEWIELHNRADAARNLAGCTVAETDRASVIEGLQVAAGAYVVVARSRDRAENGGVRADAVFGFGLGNESETLRLDCGGQVIDELAWDETAGWPEARGAALALDPGAGAGPDSWCASDVPYFGEGAGTHFGTPGAANPACPPPDLDVDACRLVEPVDLAAGAGTMFAIVGRVREAGVTDRTDGVDLDPALRAEAGFAPAGAAPEAFTWLPAAGTPGWDAAADGDEGEDEYRVRTRAPAPGAYDVAFRFSKNGGATWTICDRDGGELDAPGRLVSRDGPCAEERCDTPPPPVCGDDTTRIAWEGPGDCVEADGAAACQFLEVRTDCTELGGECLGGECIGSWPVAGAGDVVFTEILYDAAGPLIDDGAEWFEIQNVADGPRSLHGCRLEDSSNVEELRRLVLQPGQILLFGHTVDAMANGGISPDVLFGFGLGNDGDTLTIRCGDVIVDRVTWDDAFPAARKVSIALDPAARNEDANDDAGNWCLGREAYFVAPPDDDHRGTPGAPNPPCGAPSCDPNPCLDPPPTDCADDRTLRRYPRPGACALVGEATECRYAPMLEACPDARVCRRGACVLPDRQPPLPGEVVFTEIMPDPGHDLVDDNAEWFELHNRTGGRLTLDGCEIVDEAGIPERIVGGLMEPSGYLLFARSANGALNGGLRPDHLFTFRLGADGDRLRLRCGGQLIDEVDYDKFRTGSARALNLDPGSTNAEANDAAGAWCLSRQAYYRDGDGDNFGTPRAPNHACAVPVGACSYVEGDPLSGSPFAIVSGFGTVQVPGVTDRTPRVDPAPDLRGQIGLTREGEATRWFEAVPDPTWDATAAGQPGVDRYRGPFVVPREGQWGVVFRFSADGGFGWRDCAGAGALNVRDDDPCVGAGCAPTQPGEIVITEIMYDPQFGLDDDAAEWIELYNASLRPVDLDGCVLADDPDLPEALTIRDLVLEPGELAVFARSANPALNGGLAVAQTFAFALGNEGDVVELICDDVKIDRVEYDDGPDFPDAAARSLSLDPDALDADDDDGAAWCLGATPYFRDPVGADRDNFGTPGALNPACP